MAQATRLLGSKQALVLHSHALRLNSHNRRRHNQPLV